MSDISTITGLAIDAFRRWEAAKRAEGGAQAGFLALAMQVPPEDRVLFTLHTEVIRFELDRRDARDNDDQETIEACDALITGYRSKIRAMEGAKTMQDAIRALPQCTFEGCEARFDASIVEEPEGGRPGTTGWRWLPGDGDDDGVGVHEHAVAEDPDSPDLQSGMNIKKES